MYFNTLDSFCFLYYDIVFECHLGTADDGFNLLEYADPELDSALTEQHDKSIFDIHLGIVNSMTKTDPMQGLSGPAGQPLVANRGQQQPQGSDLSLGHVGAALKHQQGSQAVGKVLATGVQNVANVQVSSAPLQHSMISAGMQQTSGGMPQASGSSQQSMAGQSQPAAQQLSGLQHADTKEQVFKQDASATVTSNVSTQSKEQQPTFESSDESTKRSFEAWSQEQAKVGNRDVPGSSQEILERGGGDSGKPYPTTDFQSKFLEFSQQCKKLSGGVSVASSSSSTSVTGSGVGESIVPTEGCSVGRDSGKSTAAGGDGSGLKGDENLSGGVGTGGGEKADQSTRGERNTVAAAVTGAGDRSVSEVQTTAAAPSLPRSVEDRPADGSTKQTEESSFPSNIPPTSQVDGCDDVMIDVSGDDEDDCYYGRSTCSVYVPARDVSGSFWPLTADMLSEMDDPELVDIWSTFRIYQVDGAADDDIADNEEEGKLPRHEVMDIGRTSPIPIGNLGEGSSGGHERQATGISEPSGIVQTEGGGSEDPASGTSENRPRGNTSTQNDDSLSPRRPSTEQEASGSGVGIGGGQMVPQNASGQSVSVEDGKDPSTDRNPSSGPDGCKPEDIDAISYGGKGDQGAPPVAVSNLVCGSSLTTTLQSNSSHGMNTGECQSETDGIVSTSCLGDSQQTEMTVSSAIDVTLATGFSGDVIGTSNANELTATVSGASNMTMDVPAVTSESQSNNVLVQDTATKAVSNKAPAGANHPFVEDDLTRQSKPQSSWPQGQHVGAVEPVEHPPPTELTIQAAPPTQVGNFAHPPQMSVEAQFVQPTGHYVSVSSASGGFAPPSANQAQEGGGVIGEQMMLQQQQMLQQQHRFVRQERPRQPMQMMMPGGQSSHQMVPAGQSPHQMMPGQSPHQMMLGQSPHQMMPGQSQQQMITGQSQHQQRLPHDVMQHQYIQQQQQLQQQLQLQQLLNPQQQQQQQQIHQQQQQQLHPQQLQLSQQQFQLQQQLHQQLRPQQQQMVHSQQQQQQLQAQQQQLNPQQQQLQAQQLQQQHIMMIQQQQQFQIDSGTNSKGYAPQQQQQQQRVSGPPPPYPTSQQAFNATDMQHMRQQWMRQAPPQSPHRLPGGAAYPQYAVSGGGGQECSGGTGLYPGSAVSQYPPAGGPPVQPISRSPHQGQAAPHASARTQGSVVDGILAEHQRSVAENATASQAQVGMTGSHVGGSPRSITSPMSRPGSVTGGHSPRPASGIGFHPFTTSVSSAHHQGVVPAGNSHSRSGTPQLMSPGHAGAGGITSQPSTPSVHHNTPVLPSPVRSELDLANKGTQPDAASSIATTSVPSDQPPEQVPMMGDGVGSGVQTIVQSPHVASTPNSEAAAALMMQQQQHRQRLAFYGGGARGPTQFNPTTDLASQMHLQRFRPVVGGLSSMRYPQQRMMISEGGGPSSGDSQASTDGAHSAIGALLNQQRQIPQHAAMMMQQIRSGGAGMGGQNLGGGGGPYGGGNHQLQQMGFPEQQRYQLMPPGADPRAAAAYMQHQQQLRGIAQNQGMNLASFKFYSLFLI